MPIKDGVGYGEYTGVKIEHLSKILAMHMAITQAVIKKHASYSIPSSIRRQKLVQKRDEPCPNGQFAGKSRTIK